MSEANRTNFRISIPGDDRVAPRPRPLTMKRVLSHVGGLNLEARVKEELLRRVSRYPANSLDAAIRNMQAMIMDITQKIKEQDDGKESVVD